MESRNLKGDALIKHQPFNRHHFATYFSTHSAEFRIVTIIYSTFNLIRYLYRRNYWQPTMLVKPTYLYNK